jgi:hypothetical protein
MILSTSFNDVVKNARVQWRKGFDEVKPAARSLYDVRNVSEMTSEHSSFSGYGFAKRKQEGQAYTYGNIKQGYKLNLSQTRIGLMDAITWEMRKFDKYREIDRKMRQLGRSTAKRMELDCTHQFTFGMTAASYTNMDGETVSCATGDTQNLFDSDHTLSDGTGTIANLLTTAFSRAGLEEAETLFTKFTDDNGNKVVVEPDTIITSDDPAICNAVREFLKSTLIPDEANNAVNVYSGKYKHLVLPYLTTDANGDYSATPKNYWMLASVKNTDAIMEISENPTFIAPSAGGNGEDFETDDWKFKSAACYDLGILDFKWIVGSTGATS